MIADRAFVRRVAAPAVALIILSAGLIAQGAQKIALVTVVSDNGSRLTDLAVKDVVVREGKADRQVLSVEPATEPLVVALLLDIGAVPSGRPFPVQDLRTSVGNFVKSVTSGHPDTQVAVITVAGAAVTALDFTSKVDEVDRVVQRLYPDQQGGAVILEALTKASRKFAEKQTPRRAIVAVDFNSSELSASQTIRKVAEDVRKAGATSGRCRCAARRVGADPREPAQRRHPGERRTASYDRRALGPRRPCSPRSPTASPPSTR